MPTDWTTWRRISAQPNEDANPEFAQDYGQFKNGWTEFLAGGTNPQSQGTIPTEPGYLLDSTRVWMKGQVRGGTMGAAIFRLPIYASPPGPRLVTTIGVTSSGGLTPIVLEIVPDPLGSLVVPRGANNVRLALDGAFVTY